MELFLGFALLLWGVPLCHSQQDDLPGKQCGQRRCLLPDGRCEDAIQGICGCKGATQGDGRLACNSPKSHVCSILRASTVTNFNADRSYRMTVPCRFLATTFETRQGDTACKVAVYGQGARVAGRFWQRGFDAAVITERGKTSEFVGYRVRGEREQNEFIYTFEKKYAPEDFWFEIPFIDSAEVRFGLDGANARAKLEIPDCGLTVVFRPELPSEGKFQTVEPGLVISIDREAVEVTWPTRDEGVCLTPTAMSGGQSVTEKAQTLGLPQNLAIHFLALTESTETILHESAPCACVNVQRTLRRCEKNSPHRLPTAYDRCHFILTNPTFVTCIERRGSEASSIMALFNQCMEAFCNIQRVKCLRVQSAITAKNCQDRADAEFISFDCSTISSI